MELPGFACLNIYSIILLIFIFISSRRQQPSRGSTQQSAFLCIVASTAAVLVADLLSRLDGNAIAVPSNLLLYLGCFMLPLLWCWFLCTQIFRNFASAKPWVILQATLNGCGCLVFLLLQTQNQIYFFDSHLVYHRGPLFIIPAAFMMLALLLTEVMVLVNRKNIERAHYLSLVMFPIIPLIGGTLQTLVYGLAIELNCVSLSLLILLVQVQNRSMDIDYLTGAYNRRQLDLYMREKIRACSPDRTFSAILIDLDHFKEINDTYGHSAGDTALADSVQLLRQSLHVSDFIGRYGGDEFCIILENVSDQETLLEIINRIREHLSAYNLRGESPYALRFSMGYAVYNPADNLSMEAFQQHLDRLMYRQKQRRHLAEEMGCSLRA